MNEPEYQPIVQSEELKKLKEKWAVRHMLIRKQNKRRSIALGLHFVLSMSSAIFIPFPYSVSCILSLLAIFLAYNFYTSKVIRKIIEYGASEVEEIGDEKGLGYS